MLTANEKPGGHAGRSEVWSREEVRGLNIRCRLGVGSLCHTETTVRLRTPRPLHASVEQREPNGRHRAIVTTRPARTVRRRDDVRPAAWLGSRKGHADGDRQRWARCRRQISAVSMGSDFCRAPASHRVGRPTLQRTSGLPSALVTLNLKVLKSIVVGSTLRAATFTPVDRG